LSHLRENESSRLNAHADKYDLLPKRYDSCETALRRLVNDILGGMERQEVTALTLVLPLTPLITPFW